VISLTPRGHALLADLGAAVASIEEQMVSRLTADERSGLHDVLNRCREALAAGTSA
jgi:DNA-binding MarR family transcriptional regulator